MQQRYIHEGDNVTAAEADDFIEAVAQLTEHVAAIWRASRNSAGEGVLSGAALETL